MNDQMKFSLGLACAVLIATFMIFATFNPGFNIWDTKKVAGFYMSQGWKNLAATNTVCTIVWEYRGYDTLGEETVLFTAAIGVFAMGFGLYSAEKIAGEKSASPTSSGKSNGGKE